MAVWDYGGNSAKNYGSIGTTMLLKTIEKQKIKKKSQRNRMKTKPAVERESNSMKMKYGEKLKTI